MGRRSRRPSDRKPEGALQRKKVYVGKYVDVVKKLPHLPVEQSDYQLKVEAAKAVYRELNAAGIAAAYRKLRDEDDALGVLVKALNVQIAALEQLAAEVFEAEGIDMVKLADGSSLSIQLEPYAGVEDREAFRLWCVEQGMASSMHLWPATTQSLVKQILLEGQPMPPGVKAFIKAKPVLRGRGPKAQ